MRPDPSPATSERGILFVTIPFKPEGYGFASLLYFTTAELDDDGGKFVGFTIDRAAPFGWGNSLELALGFMRFIWPWPRDI